jgi:hypothetical protein
MRDRISLQGDSPPPSQYDHLSEVDRLILQYNHKGLTGSKISKTLSEQHGIQIAKITVNKHLMDLRQDPANSVRLNSKIKTPTKPKEQNKWYQIILKLKETIPEYTDTTGFKPSSRTMVYQFRDEGIISESEIGYFIRATVHARLGYKDSSGELMYPKLDLDCFAEDKTRLAVENYDNEEPREMIPPTDPDYEAYKENVISQARDTINYYDGVGTYGIDARRGGRWYNQPEYVEVWEEKNDLIDGFKIILESRKVNIKANHGFSSLDFLRKCTEELKKFIDETGIDPKHVHIIYCGDCDPSGETMDYYIQKRLRLLGIVGVYFERIAVKYEHIKKYGLKTLPIEQVDPNKTKDDPNLKEYRRIHGQNAVGTHLNAFFTKKHLTAFKKILLAAVDKHWDKSIYDKMVKDYSAIAPPPKRYTDESMKEIRKGMREETIEALKEDQRKEDLTN